MINEIYVDGKLLLEKKPKSFFNNGYNIKCNECCELIERKWLDYKIFKELYTCKKCIMLNHNPMDKPEVKEKHKSVVTSNEYRNQMSVLTKGEKNGFYGKTHTNTTKKHIKKGFKLWLNGLTVEEYDNWRGKMSNGNKKLMEEQPEFYHKIKSMAARQSHLSQFKNMKMNGIETIINDYLKTLDVDFKYSVILNDYQYDFGIKSLKILIEVNGDYWHGNPKFYNYDGSDNKKVLNEIQINKKNKDIEKITWAKEKGFTVISIWEDDINHNNFKKQLKYEIEKNRDNRD